MWCGCLGGPHKYARCGCRANGYANPTPTTPRNDRYNPTCRLPSLSQ